MSRSALALALATAKRWSSSDLANYHNNKPSNAHELSHKIRALLRETAQPVAVVTSFMPNHVLPSSISSSAQPSSSSSSSIPTPRSTSGTTTTRFHGATLSSFTSISMAPHHLVAFSLRIPSRMATSLADLSSSSAASGPSSSSACAHMVVNLLSAPQTHAATLFSRPDLHPRPFEDPGIQWSPSRDGLPVLHGSLGALSCRVVGAPWPLNDLAALGDKLSNEKMGRTRDGVEADGVQSELFIAQVMRVEDVPPVAGADDGYDDTIRTLPLVYHRRSYTTTADKLLLNQETNS